jgi:hypothetical protein
MDLCVYLQLHNIYYTYICTYHLHTFVIFHIFPTFVKHINYFLYDIKGLTYVLPATIQ